MVSEVIFHDKTELVSIFTFGCYLFFFYVKIEKILKFRYFVKFITKKEGMTILIYFSVFQVKIDPFLFFSSKYGQYFFHLGSFFFTNL